MQTPAMKPLVENAIRRETGLKELDLAPAFVSDSGPEDNEAQASIMDIDQVEAAEDPA